jgi:hypothetical protein
MYLCTGIPAKSGAISICKIIVLKCNENHLLLPSILEQIFPSIHGKGHYKLQVKQVEGIHLTAVVDHRPFRGSTDLILAKQRKESIAHVRHFLNCLVGQS